MLDENFDLVKQALAQGVNPISVSNFKGKEILDNMHDLKIEYDSEYFNRQTYREFLADPLGAKLIDAWAATDPDVQDNVKLQDRVRKVIENIAAMTGKQIDLEAPSLAKQKQMHEEEMRK